MFYEEEYEDIDLYPVYTEQNYLDCDLDRNLD